MWPYVDCTGEGARGRVPAIAGLTHYTWAVWLQAQAPPGTTTIDNVFSNGSSGGEAFGLAWSHLDAPARQAAYHRGADGHYYNVQMPGPPLSAGVWRHVAATYDGDTVRLYVQGQDVSHLSGLSAQPPAGQFPVCGQLGGNQAWRGQLDDLTVWNRALSAGEIATYVTQSTARHGPGR